MFAGIKDLTIEDHRYKMFYYPFRLGNSDVILCGFINQKNYDAELHEIPVSFIYPIVITFLIILIFLPIIKFYMMGRDETVKFIDITLSTLSLIAGPALITLILIQVLLLDGADMRSKSNLNSLSSQIDSAFTADIITAYKQLNSLDSLMSIRVDSMNLKAPDTQLNVSPVVINYFKLHKDATKLDYNFDRIFWTDSLGRQKIKGQVGNEATLFTDVSARNYFKILKNNKAYMLPGYDSLFFGLEPINSWQSAYFNDIRFYGKTNAVNITPISRIPFFLVTFYDNGYIVPIDMRIFTFALLFCIFSFLFYFIIWVLIFRKQYYVNPMLYSPMVFLTWAISKNEKSRFYVLASRFLTGYTFMLLLFMALSTLLNISNYVVLVPIFIIPVNVISILFVINYAVTKRNNNDKTKLNKKKALSAIGFQLLSSVLVYLYSGYSSYSSYPIQYQFLIFQAVFNMAMLVFFFSSEKTLNSFSRSKRTYLPEYSVLVTTIIICLAVLPAGIYTWYAHNQEITQSVKKGQLYLAESLQKRSSSIIKFTRSQAGLELPNDYYQNLQYRSGIYKIYDDSIHWNNGYIPPSTLKASYEQFYFGIANKIGNNYYDPLLMPALKDSASDAAWSRASDNSSLYFKYTLPDNFKPVNEKNDVGKSLSIVSNFPSRYLFIGFNLRGLMLVIIIGALVIGLYRLLHSLTGRIFLKKYIATIKSKGFPENEMETLLAEFKATRLAHYPALDNAVKNLRNEYGYYMPAQSNKEIYEQEKAMIDINASLKVFYNFIWQKLTEKEKYLLLDFAMDNLINFKNIEVIYQLLEKGLFIVNDDEIKIVSPGFRAYVFDKKNTPEIYQLQKKLQLNSSWQSFRTPLLIVLLGIALFVFFTRQETFQKLTAIVAGVTSVLSLLLKVFVNSGSADSTGK